MGDKFLPDISVGDFAMDLLKDMAKDPNGLKPALKESTLEAANAPDVSRVNVPDDFVALVTEGKKPARKTIKVIKESSEDRLTNIISKLSALLVEARQLVEELSPGATTVGNLGVNMAGPSKKKKKLKKKDDKNPYDSCVAKLKTKFGFN